MTDIKSYIYNKIQFEVRQKLILGYFVFVVA